MQPESLNSDRDSRVAQRIRSLIDGGSSCNTGDDSSDIASCLSVLLEIWPGDGRSEASSNGSGPDSDQKEVPHLPQQLGRFQIRRFLGHGGFGIVLLAYDETLDREVALKLPRPEFLFSKEMRSRSVREAKLAALLDHRGIVPVFDAGEVGAVWYIAAGYVKGPSLAQWLSENPACLSSCESAAIVQALAEAAQHAHSRGILHRDLKPSNVLLEPSETRIAKAFPFVPRLTDFGLAKRLENSEQETLSGTLLGTPRYMAPEQAANREKEIGIQTDVYGLGGILHELLTGQPPFVADSNEAVLARIQKEEVSPARLRQSKVPKDLETVCLKCLEREPASRYQTAGALADDLRRFAAGEPVDARPIGRVSRLFRWARRRPLVAALSIALLIAVTGGAIVAGWQWMRAEQHLRESLAATSRAEDNLLQAEQTLSDLAWLVEESSLWAQESSQFRDAVQDKLKRYHEQIRGQKGRPSGSPAITAAILSFAARSAALAGDTVTADRNYRLALDAWREAASADPKNAEYRRAWSLCLLHFSELLTDVRVQDGIDQSNVLQPFYENISRDPRYGPVVLSDYASLMLDHGVRLSRTNRKGGRDALKAGLIAAQVLCDTSPIHPSPRLLAAKLWRSLGVVEGAMRDYPNAERSLDEAINILEKLRAGDAANTDYMAELAQAFFERGLFAGRQNDKQRVIESMERSVALSDLLAKTSGGDPPNRLRRAVSLRSLGKNLGAQSRAEESRRALVEYGEALGEIDRRHEQIPPEELRFWGGVCHQLGIEFKGGGDFAAALDSFLKGAKAFERARDLAVKFSSIDSLRQGECYFLAAVLQQSDQKDEAARNLDKCLAMLKSYMDLPNPDQHLKRLQQKVVATLADLDAERRIAKETDELIQRKTVLEETEQSKATNDADREELFKIHLRLGAIAREQERYAEARHELEQALAVAAAIERNVPSVLPDIASAHRQLGIVLRKLNDETGALSSFSSAHKGFGRAKELELLSGDQAALMGNACHEEGTLAYRSGQQEQARIAFADGASAYEQASDQAHALTTTERFEWAECHAVLGIIEAEHGKLSEAVQSLENATSMLLPLTSAAESTALFKLRLSQWQEALASAKNKLAE